jgi:transcription-repair coupling factor (superfamily II helicase)
MIPDFDFQLTTYPQFIQIIESLAQPSGGEPQLVRGLAGSLKSIFVAALHTQTSRQILVIAADKGSAERMHDDLQLASGNHAVSLFRGFREHPEVVQEVAKTMDDTVVLRSLLCNQAGIVVTDPQALVPRFHNPAVLKDYALSLEAGKEFGFSRCVDWLAHSGFEKKDFVETHGDYSVRGGILDVFSFAGENPLRVEFFGDSVESLREFDALSQRSVRELSAATIVPNLLSARWGDPKMVVSSSLLDFLHPDALVVLEEPELIRRAIQEEAQRRGGNEDKWREVESLLALFPRLHILSLSTPAAQVLDFASHSQPPFNGSIKILKANLAELQNEGYRITISCDSQSELTRLNELLAEVEPGDDVRRSTGGSIGAALLDLGRIRFSLHAFHEGFVLPGSRVALYTEHQVFNRVKRRGKPRKPKFRGFSEKEIQQLRRGDYVVHLDYGIGRFDGLKRMRVGDIVQEVVKISYEENDSLYVNLNYVNKIQKYSSREGHIPKLTRLGSADWEKLKAKAKKRIKDIARDLIQFYARRKASQGFSFDPDTPWQKELEASFAYEDTYDQARSTREVKQDMEVPHPMDRLVCGDVGFGKTEVAVRAAFKCVMNGKQVAVLVPTTILAMQHYNTFVDRLERYSVNIDVLSRFKSRKEQAEIIGRLNTGGIDIVIGTHRLLSKDVGFKDLGLLVIDEEHRFGVAAKEKLRRLKASVDTLTLTATPIPRTLHFSLMGARDLSIIGTPPRNRLPVITEITQYSSDLIVEAVRRELHRRGQVYFVHDRIQTIEDITSQLRALMPDVRIQYVHGQMRPHELEEGMVKFLEKDVDVLVCTKIIESGLDLPNVNTIIINRADRFGMAELYQLRGRVGRSNQQAYAYLLVPPPSVLPRATLLRLQALEEFTELGSGFNLAMRDLEIRGAGNLLGAEQSGFIETMGFETYSRILDEAVNELKEQEFQGIFERRDAPLFPVETVVEAEFDALIPDFYVENDAERLGIYRRLYGLDSIEQLDELSLELEDRFGADPPEVVNLLNVVRIRLVASRLGIRKVRVTRNGFEIEFPEETERSTHDQEKLQSFIHFVAQRKDQDLSLTQSQRTLKFSKRTYGGTQCENPLRSSLEFLSEIEASTAREHPDKIGQS